jgi:hypothetical protein
MLLLAKELTFFLRKLSQFILTKLQKSKFNDFGSKPRRKLLCQIQISGYQKKSLQHAAVWYGLGEEKESEKRTEKGGFGAASKQSGEI